MEQTSVEPGQRAVVLGLGRFGGGTGAARYLARQGARVIATDLRSAAELPEAVAALEGLENVELVLGRHRAADLESAALVVANPAVPRSSPWLQCAKRARITTEIELLLGATHARRIGVTGTHGKTSTATFTARLLEAAGCRVALGGNLGGSLLDRLGELDERTVLVLELSSYQLEHLGAPPANARPFEALAVTGLLDDHLDRHGGRPGYSAAKRRILELGGPESSVWVEADLARSNEWHAALEAGGFASIDRFRASTGPAHPDLPELGQLPAFQRANVALALGLASRFVSDRPALLATLPTLSTPEHRGERLAPARVPGGELAVIDNGVSTTPDSSAAVVAGLTGPLRLLVGGHDKGLDLAPLLRACRGRLARAYAFGAAAEAFAAAFDAAGLPVLATGPLESAVARALAEAQPGDTLVFSPAAASFDAFPNFRERALAFRRALEL